nr:hypothetical protein [Polymorphobacter sp. PAMC 29334]
MVRVEARPQNAIADRPRPLRQNVERFKIAGNIVRPVIIAELTSKEEIACAELARSSSEQSKIVAVDAAGACHERSSGIDRLKLRRTCSKKIADIRPVGPLGVVDRINEFRDDEIDVSEALSVRVRPHVDRHTVDELGEVGAVIEVEAAQEILVGLAAARMLRSDETWDDFEQFADPLNRTIFEVDLSDCPLGCRIGNPNKVCRAPGNDDLGPRRRGRRIDRHVDSFGTSLSGSGKERRAKKHRAQTDHRSPSGRKQTDDLLTRFTHGDLLGMRLGR